MTKRDVEYKPTGRRAVVSGGTPEPYFTYAEIKAKIDSFEATLKYAEEYKLEMDNASLQYEEGHVMSYNELKMICSVFRKELKRLK